MLKRRYLTVPLVVVALVFAVANTVDRPLNPEIAPLIARMQAPVRQQDNGYFYLLGMQANVDEGLYDTGRELQQQYEQHLADTPLSYYEHDFSSPAWAREPGFLCKPAAGVSCLATYREHKRDLDELLFYAGDYLQRYARLLAYRDFQVPLSFYPSGRKVIQYHSLYLAFVGKDWLDGKHEVALQRLLDAQRFWRMARASKGEMAFEFMAQQILSMNLRLLGELLDGCDDCGRYRALVDATLTPFTPAEMSMSEVILKEFADVSIQVRRAYETGQVTVAPYDLEDRILPRLVLINEMQNQAYELYSKGAYYFGLPVEVLAERIDEWYAFYNAYWSPSFADYFFNFAATRLHERAIPSGAFVDLYEGSMKLEALRAQIAARYVNQGDESSQQRKDKGAGES